MRRLFIILLSFCAVLSCDKSDLEISGQETDLSSGSVPLTIIEQSKVLNNVSKDIEIPSVDMASSDAPCHVFTKLVPGKGLIECHIQVLPLYVFGKEGAAGDYYAVTGYVVAHNADCYNEYTTMSTNEPHMPTKVWGWYMKDLGLHFELLTEDGKPVRSDKVKFFVNPEPSTTIGATIYKKGFEVVLDTSLSVGAGQKEEEGEMSWKILALGNLGVSINWINKSSQVLPDQSVEMSTSSFDRSVTYHFKTNNDMGGYATKFIPPLFRTDQRVDFSWVWHVPSGNYSAVDYGFKGMKFRATINPLYYSKADGRYEITEEEYRIIKSQEIKSNNKPTSWTFDLPGMNRIPTGYIRFKNTTRNYVQSVEIYRQGEYKTKKKSYCSVEGAFSQDESFKTMIRVGTYDLYYELRNGDTGALIGKFYVPDIKIEKGQTAIFSTMNAQKIQ